MPRIAANYAQYLGQVVGDGHCVALVQICSSVGHTSNWRRGALAAGGHHPEGCVIATFNRGGRYTNSTDGSSHVAILLVEQVDGLLVQDQWQGQPCHHRLIRFKNGQDLPCDDGDSYYLVERP